MSKVTKILFIFLSLLISITVSVSYADTTTTTATATPNNSATFSPQQKQAIEKIIHHYLVNNPNVLVEASQALQRQRMQAAQQQALKAIQQNKTALFENPKTPSITSHHKKATKPSAIIIEFFDYQCGHCKDMASIIEKLVKNNNVKVIFKEFPIFGKNSEFAARAALAAMSQKQYYAFHNALFAAPNPLNNKKVLAIAKKTGLNIKKLRADMKNKTISKQLAENRDLASKLGLVGTPAFVVANDKLTHFAFIPGTTSLELLKQYIKQVNTKTNPNNDS